MAPPLLLSAPCFLPLYLDLLFAYFNWCYCLGFFAMIFCGSFESRTARNACLPGLRLGQPFGCGPGLGVFLSP